MKNGMTLAVLGVIGAMILFGCATTGTKAVVETSDHPQFETLCSKCHTLDRVFAAHQAMPKDEMHRIVEKMVQKPESGINPADIDDIVNEIY